MGRPSTRSGSSRTRQGRVGYSSALFAGESDRCPKSRPGAERRNEGQCEDSRHVLQRAASARLFADSERPT